MAKQSRIISNSLKSQSGNSAAQASSQTIAFGAALGTIEIGLGSVLHSLRIPLSGQLLSLNQILMLTLLVRRFSDKPLFTAPFHASCQAMLMKSFAPAGKRLTPMIAIGMQGLLFSSGTCVFGFRLPGVLCGAILSSLWSFVQPMLILTVVFGRQLWQGAKIVASSLESILSISEHNIIQLAIALIAIKVSFAMCVSILGWFGHDYFARRYDQMIASRSWSDSIPSKKTHPTTPYWRLALYDLTRPLFICGLLLTVLFLYFENSPWSAKIWLLARPIAFTYFGFLLLRHPSVEAWVISRIQHVQKQ